MQGSKVLISAVFCYGTPSFDTDDFATASSYTPTGGSASTVNGIFNNEYFEVDPLSGVGVDERIDNGAVCAGAKGIVVGAMPPGYTTAAEHEALCRAAKAGVALVQSTRAGSGRVGDVPSRRAPGAVLADNLTPQKARILLMLGLTATQKSSELQRMFDEY